MHCHLCHCHRLSPSLSSGYYHQVTSYGTQNTAVALLFARLEGVSDIDFSGCDQPLSYKPLSEMDVDWKYSGYGNLSMGNTDLESVRYLSSSRMFKMISVGHSSNNCKNKVTKKIAIAR